MIIKAPIDLELTQISGQTSQPPWKEINGSFSDLVFVEDDASVFNVKQNGQYIDFNYTGNIDESQAIEKPLKKCYNIIKQ